MEIISDPRTATHPPRRLQRLVLVVEDSDEDFAAFCRALESLPMAEPVVRCRDGDDCLDYLGRTGPYTGKNTIRPSLILLDLNLPGTDGREVLEILDTDKIYKSIPVVVVTTSTNPQDVELCYRHGANSYLAKTQDWKRFVDTVHLLMSYWLTAVVLPDKIS